MTAADRTALVEMLRCQADLAQRFEDVVHAIHAYGWRFNKLAARCADKMPPAVPDGGDWWQDFLELAQLVEEGLEP